MDEPDYNFPRTYSDFLELREYLNFLKSSLDDVDPKKFNDELAESYSNILNGIEAALTLAELDFSDDVLHVCDAKDVLSKIYGKPVL